MLIAGIFSTVDINKAYAADDLYKYSWPFKTQQMTVKLDKNNTVTGYEVYRGFTNKVGITMNFKVSEKTGLTVTSANYYKYGIMWPVAVKDKSKTISKKSASVGKTATAHAIYTGQVIMTSGIPLLTEYPRADGKLTLVSIDKKKKTAVVKFTGTLKQ